MKSRKTYRWIILSTILIGTMAIQYLHIHGTGSYPSVHAICPVGGIENFWAWLGGQGNLKKIFSGTMTLFFLTTIFAILFGRAFCGNICPFGFLQELLSKITKKKIIIPKKLDKNLRYLKYAVLAFVTIMAWITATIWISPYDPYAAFSHIWSGSELLEEMPIGLVVLIIVVGASVFIDRFFCKYLCPAGAFYGMLSKISPTKIKRQPCKECGLCSKNCPMNIDVKSCETVTSAECIMCGECVNSCNKGEGDTYISIFGKTVKPVAFVLLTVAIFFGSIFVLDKAGLYRVTTPTVEAVIENGKYLKPADLKGSMTIESGAKYLGISLDEFYKLMEIPSSVPKETKMSSISEFVPSFDFHVIKDKKTID